MKTWLITGCSSGIGKGIAKAVLESGDQAIVTARNKDKVMDIVEAYPEAALAVSLDVCSQDSIKNAVKEAYDKFGTIDVLVNNAGYGYRSAVEEGEIEAVQTLYQTNLFGPIELIKAVLPKMREQKSGYILNVTSIAAARSAVGSGYYASSKAALELLTNGLMKELAPLGIKAMKTLQKDNKNKMILSNSMLMFILINTASIQLIPTNVIAIRNSLNSSMSTQIIFPVWIATITAALASIITAKVLIRLGK